MVVLLVQNSAMPLKMLRIPNPAVRLAVAFLATALGMRLLKMHLKIRVMASCLTNQLVLMWVYWYLHFIT